LGSNIFDFSIWVLFIAIGTKKTLKKMSVKNATVLIKAQKAQFLKSG
jgi:hypothetical protein